MALAGVPTRALGRTGCARTRFTSGPVIRPTGPRRSLLRHPAPEDDFSGFETETAAEAVEREHHPVLTGIMTGRARESCPNVDRS